VERGWIGANEQAQCNCTAVLSAAVGLLPKLDYLEKYMSFTFGLLKCKPVLESADENVYYSKKECHMEKKKTVFEIGLP
jgi:hypothetical protein